MTVQNEAPRPQNLREQVEALLPSWRSWYPSLFDAAEDLGLIRARVCPPSMLALSNRHASIRNEAVQAFREQWSVEDEPAAPMQPMKGKNNGRRPKELQHAQHREADESVFPDDDEI